MFELLCFVSFGFRSNAFPSLTREHQPLHEPVDRHQAQRPADLFVLRPVVPLAVFGAVVHVQAPVREEATQGNEMERNDAVNKQYMDTTQ